MLKLLKIAVTGGLASGKSSVCAVLEESGAYVVSADQIVHQLLSLNTLIGQQVVDLLGLSIVENGHLNRKNIANVVFSDRQKLKALEKILHPAVLDEIEQKYHEVQQTQKYNLFVAEIPLLYESEAHIQFDYILCVTSDPELALKRFQEKTHLSREEYHKRMSFQMPLHEKITKAHFTLTNNGDLEQLKTQVYSFLKELHCP